MENGPPGIYLYTSQEDLERRFRTAEARLDRPMSEIEFYRIVAPIVASAKHGHMIARPSENTFDRYWTQTPLLPLGIRILSGDAMIFRDFSGETSSLVGARLVSVNGVSATQLLRRMGESTSIDAGQAVARDRVLSGMTFNLDLATLFDMRAPFAVEVEQNGARRRVTLDGIQDLATAWAAQFPNDREVRARSPARLAFDGDTAILTIPHWDYEEDGATPAADYQAFMEEIAANNARALIIDVRDNGGGDDALASLLLSYLVDEPFQYFRCVVFKNDHFDWLSHATGESTGYAAELPNYVAPASPECAQYGSFALVNRPNLGLVAPRAPRFAGRVFVLMNAGSFSTSVEFAAHIHSTGRGVLIGEAPHGSYWSNDSGITPTIALPNSRLLVEVPLIHYLHNLRDDVPIGGVVPADRPITPSLAQMLSGADPEMDLARGLAREN